MGEVEATVKELAVYKDKDLVHFRDVFNKAEKLWGEKTRAYVKTHGDVGTAVLGDGIAIEYLPPRCRKSRTLIVVQPSGAQGSACYEQYADEIMAYLKSEGIDCFYCYGRMD